MSNYLPKNNCFKKNFRQANLTKIFGSANNYLKILTRTPAPSPCAIQPSTSGIFASYNGMY